MLALFYATKEKLNAFELDYRVGDVRARNGRGSNYRHGDQLGTI